MYSYSQFFLNFAMVQMFTCCLLLLPKAAKSLSISLFILLLVCGSGYSLGDLFGPLTSMSFLWWFSYIAGNALPGVFWLVSLSIFADKQAIKSWQYSVASLTLLIPLCSTLLQLIFNFDLREFPAFFGLVTYGAMALELVLICYALAVAVKHWQADLVQERRYMRGGVITLTALYLFVVIVVEQLFNLEWQWLDTVKYVCLAALVTGINFLLFALREGTLFDAPVAQAPEVEVAKTPSPELQRIIDAMKRDKLYRQEGLTISVLSRHLSIHEYKLRQLINGELAYRNFNDFLNHYRIQEVTDKLGDEENGQLPVLTLALESGFRSLSSFNKAFKGKHGVTPTEYRSQIQKS